MLSLTADAGISENHNGGIFIEIKSKSMSCPFKTGSCCENNLSNSFLKGDIIYMHHITFVHSDSRIVYLQNMQDMTWNSRHLCFTSFHGTIDQFAVYLLEVSNIGLEFLNLLTLLSEKLEGCLIASIQLLDLCFQLSNPSI